MTVYIIMFAFLASTGLLAQRFSKHHWPVSLYCGVTWLVLTITAALRWGIGLDYNQYYNVFYVVRNAADWGEVFQLGYEPAFLVFYRLVSYFSGNIIVLLFLYYGLLYGLLMYYIYKYSEYKWCAVMAFFALDYFAMSFCFMRQGMAMVIGLFALEMIKKRRVFWAIALSLIAATFHVSALLLLLCLVVSYINTKKPKLFRLYVIFAIMICIGCDYILEHFLVGPFAKYAAYLDTQFMGGNPILIVYYPIVVFILVVCFYKKLCEVDKEFHRMLPVLFLGTLLSVMTTQHYLLERMSLYITFYNIRVMAQILHMIRIKMSKELYHTAVIGTVMLCISAYIFGLMNDRYGIRPYQLNEMHINNVSFFYHGY